jgi:hypothetical protein
MPLDVPGPLLAVPFVRRAIGETLLGVATPSWFKRGG